MSKKLCAALIVAGVCIPATADAHPLVHGIGQTVHWLWTHFRPIPGTPIIPGTVNVSHTLTRQVFASAATNATLQTITTATTTFTVTKVGAASLMVASSAAVANATEYVLPTREIWKGMNYQIDEKRAGKLIDQNIADAAIGNRRYIARYCLLPNGEKEIIPVEFERCSIGRSEPFLAEEFAYR